MTFSISFFALHVRKNKWVTLTESGEKGVGLGEGVWVCVGGWSGGVWGVRSHVRSAMYRDISKHLIIKIPKNGTLDNYHRCPKNGKDTFNNAVMYLNNADGRANTVDPEHSALYFMVHKMLA